MVMAQTGDSEDCTLSLGIQRMTSLRFSKCNWPDVVYVQAEIKAEFYPVPSHINLYIVLFSG